MTMMYTRRYETVPSLPAELICKQYLYASGIFFYFMQSDVNIRMEGSSVNSLILLNLSAQPDNALYTRMLRI